jgi:hypothetical protein
MYSASQLDMATTCFLTDCQLTGALAEEEEDPACALAGVDVVGVVAVPDKVCLPRAPRVLETVVKSPHNIADDPLHSLLVLRRWSL